MVRGLFIILAINSLLPSSDARGRVEAYLISPVIPEGVSYFGAQVETRWHGGQKTLSLKPHSVSINVSDKTLRGFNIDGQETALAFSDIISVKIAFGSPPRHESVFKLDSLYKGIAWNPRGRVIEIGLMSGEVWEFHGRPPTIEAHIQQIRWQNANGIEESIPFRELFFIKMEWQAFPPLSSPSATSFGYSIVIQADRFLEAPRGPKRSPLANVQKDVRIRVGIQEAADQISGSLLENPIIGSVVSTEELILTLKTQEEQVSIPVSSIQSLDVSCGKKNDAVRGFFLGLGLGLLAAEIVGPDEASITPETRQFYIALGSTIFGTVIGAMHITEKWETIPLMTSNAEHD
jgi:hypothetical protein